MKTPVVFLIFNRPDKTEEVFKAIRQAQPSQLLVVADGPRPDRPDEAEKCAATRAIINLIDWDCEVFKNYSDVNLGCKKRVSSGLDWVFRTVEEAIILEDDCIPDPSFFSFCEELLVRYRHNDQIGSIGGLNVQFERQLFRYSYYFSRFPHIWGWATWRRVWQSYDVNMTVWPEIRDIGLLKNILPNSRASNYWTKIFQATYEGQIDTWDYQWIFNCLIHNSLSIVPKVNLVANLGFGAEATHTVNSSESSQYFNMPIETIEFPLKHPPYIIPDINADNFTQNTYYDPVWIERLKWKLTRIRKMKNFIFHPVHSM